MKPTPIILSVLSLSALTLAATTLLPKPGITIPVVLPANGAEPDDASNSPLVTGNGRLVVFATQASNLVPGDPDGLRDVAVVSMLTGEAHCVSVSTAGVKGNSGSADPAVDRRGRHVAFASMATNLVDLDTNDQLDIFVHDRKAHTTVRVSVASDGTQADDLSEQPWLSGSGRLVVFASRATNLVAGDTNGVSDIFVHDLSTGETRRVTIGVDGLEADGGSFLPRISANGRYVAYISQARNLVEVDNNAKRDVFVTNLKTGKTEMVSVGPAGVPSDGNSGTLSISANGRRIVFDSMGHNLVADADQWPGMDVFLRDRKKHTTTLVSRGLDGQAADEYSQEPAISANGKWLAFTSLAGNIVADDTNGANDVFRKRVKTGEVVRVSVSSQGAQGDANSGQAALSRNGRYVVFATRATNLFDDVTGGEWLVAMRRP